MGRSKICKSLERRNRGLQTGRVRKPDSAFVWNLSPHTTYLHISKGDVFFSEVSNPAEVEVLDVAVKQTIYYDKDFKAVFYEYYLYNSVVYFCLDTTVKWATGRDNFYSLSG